MTLTVTHAFVSGIADDPKASVAGEVLPSHWNANHVVSGFTGRTALSADANYYVSATGSDSNGGTNSSTDAWATIQHAMDFIASNIDFNSHNVIVNIGAGTFVGFGVKSTVGGGNLFFKGAGSGSTTINGGPSDGVFNFGENVSVIVLCNSALSINAVKFGANAGLNMVSVINEGVSLTLADLFTFDADFVFDLANSATMINIGAQSLVQTGITGTSFINGNGATGINALTINSGGIFIDFASWTVHNGNVTIGTAWCLSSNGYYVSTGNSWGVAGPATVTGKRYSLYGGSTAQQLNFSGTGKLGANFFPGDTDGTSDPGSTYDGFSGAVQASGLPTTTQFPDPNTGGLYKDTSGGGVYIVYNDAGTIKKVALT